MDAVATAAAATAAAATVSELLALPDAEDDDSTAMVASDVGEDAPTGGIVEVDTCETHEVRVGK